MENNLKIDYSAFIKPSQYVRTVLSDKDVKEKIVFVFQGSQYPWERCDCSGVVKQNRHSQSFRILEEMYHGRLFGGGDVFSYLEVSQKEMGKVEALPGHSMNKGQELETELYV